MKISTTKVEGKERESEKERKEPQNSFEVDLIFQYFLNSLKQFFHLFFQ